MKSHLILAGSALLLLTLLSVPAGAQAAERACTLQCFATVPTVTVAEGSTYFIGEINWWDCPGVPTYIWDFGDGSPTNASQIGWHRYMTPGTYTWTLTVNLEGDTCTQTGSIVADPPTSTCGFGGADLPTGLSLVGSASRSQGAGVELTPATAAKTGAAWCMGLQQVYGGFETTFHFRVDPPRRDTAGAEGFAFVLMYHGLQYTTALGMGQEGLGYQGLWGFAVEFDTLMNPNNNDPDGNHVAAIRKRSGSDLVSDHTYSIATAAPPFEIADGVVHEARILYESENLSVFLDGATDPVISVPVNLADINSFPGGEAFVGFTSSTSSEFESHRILDWTFSPAGPACVLTCGAVAPAAAEPGVPAYFVGSAGTTNCTGTPAFDWDFGDGSPHDATPNPVHTYAADGTYAWTMTVTVEDQTCTEAGSVTVRTPCSIACTVNAPDAGTVGVPLNFQAEAISLTCPTPATYAWTFGDGGTSSEQNPTHAYAAPGTYTWTLTATIEDATCTESGTVTVTEACALTCSASVLDSALVGQAVNFSAQATATDCAGGPSFSWAFGDGGTSSEQFPSHAYTAGGSYAWTLTVTAGSETCTRNGTIAVTGLPGDCNGDGTVSIGEVQKAINMFLGLEPVGCGADCNGDGTVSIGEVQKVINAFLGIGSTC